MTPQGQPCSYRNWLWAALNWENIRAGKRQTPGGLEGYHLPEDTQKDQFKRQKILYVNSTSQSPILLLCAPALWTGLSPSSPLGRKPPLAQSSMGLTWSSGLSDSQGGNVFSARVLAIWERTQGDYKAVSGKKKKKRWQKLWEWVTEIFYHISYNVCHFKWNTVNMFIFIKNY